jgi:hypothetical protein
MLIKYCIVLYGVLISHYGCFHFNDLCCFGLGFVSQPGTLIVICFLLGVEETESVYSETSGGNIGPLSPYHRRRQSSNVSDGSKGSVGSAGKMLSRNIAAAPLTLAKLRKDTENMGDLKFNYLNK